MILLLLGALLQGDGVPLRLQSVEGATAPEFTGEGDVDLPDGVRFRVSLYYGRIHPSRRVARTRVAVRDGSFRFHVAAPRLPLLPGLWRIEVEPESNQPGTLPVAVLRELPQHTAHHELRVGSEADAERVGARVRAELVADMDRAIAAAGARHGLAAVVLSVERRRLYDLLGLRGIASQAFEDLAAAARARRPPEGLRRIRDHYRVLLNVDGRDPGRAAEAIVALRRGLADGLSAPVQRRLLEIGWHFSSESETVQQLAGLLRRGAHGEVEAILKRLEDRLKLNRRNSFVRQAWTDTCFINFSLIQR